MLVVVALKQLFHLMLCGLSSAVHAVEIPSLFIWWTRCNWLLFHLVFCGLSSAVHAVEMPSLFVKSELFDAIGAWEAVEVLAMGKSLITRSIISVEELVRVFRFLFGRDEVSSLVLSRCWSRWCLSRCLSR